MGFYGKIGQKELVQIDKIYPNKLVMDLNCDTDEVFVNRYVLVNYRHATKQEYVDKLKILFNTKNQSSDITSQEAQENYEADEEIELSNDYMELQEAIKNLKVNEYNYDINYKIDKLYYNGQSDFMKIGYDSTLWMKIYENDKISYQYIGSLTPKIDIGLYTGEEQIENQPNNGSETSEEVDNLTKQYPYFNEAGFSREKSNKDIWTSGADDNIGFSMVADAENNLYTEQIKINLPQLGNAISEFWDIVYGPNQEGYAENDPRNGTRNLIIGEDGRRYYQQQFDKDGKPINTLKTDDLNTVVGCINTLQDLIGKFEVIKESEAEAKSVDEISENKIYCFMSDSQYEFWKNNVEANQNKSIDNFTFLNCNFQALKYYSRITKNWETIDIGTNITQLLLKIIHSLGFKLSEDAISEALKEAQNNNSDYAKLDEIKRAEFDKKVYEEIYSNNRYSLLGALQYLDFIIKSYENIDLSNLDPYSFRKLNEYCVLEVVNYETEQGDEKTVLEYGHRTTAEKYKLSETETTADGKKKRIIDNKYLDNAQLEFYEMTTKAPPEQEDLANNKIIKLATCFDKDGNKQLLEFSDYIIDSAGHIINNVVHDGPSDGTVYSAQNKKVKLEFPSIVTEYYQEVNGIKEKIDNVQDLAKQEYKYATAETVVDISTNEIKFKKDDIMYNSITKQYLELMPIYISINDDNWSETLSIELATLADSGEGIGDGGIFSEKYSIKLNDAIVRNIEQQRIFSGDDFNLENYVPTIYFKKEYSEKGLFSSYAETSDKYIYIYGQKSKILDNLISNPNQYIELITLQKAIL